MSIPSLMNDRLVLKSESGSVICDEVRAFVDGDEILVSDITVPIEVGTRLSRTLPSGVIEEFVVDNFDYLSPELVGSEAHYRIDFTKTTSKPRSSGHTIVNNISGANARILIDSTDNSQNYYLSEPQRESLQPLLEALKSSHIPSEDAALIEGKILQMAGASSKQSFADSYNEFMASAANHMTVFVPFLPLLTSFLS